jgi:MoaA/NifB/PqqE/SkfB family radical SAM enzyme
MGGEPLLRQDLEEIVLRFRDAGVFVKVISNGHSLTSCRAESLCKAGLNQIEVSLDGLLPETHNASRGPGSFEKALRGVKRAIDGGIPRVGLVWTVHSTNVHECDRLPWLMQDLRVEECYLSRFRKTGLCGSAAPFNPPSDSDLTLLRSSIGQWRRAFPNLTIVLPEACSCGRTSVVLGADGAVRVCSFLYESHGNVKKEPLRAIWDRLGELAQASGPLGYCGKPELAFMKHSE